MSSAGPNHRTAVPGDDEVSVMTRLSADPGDAWAGPSGHRSTAASGPHQRTVLVGALESSWSVTVGAGVVMALLAIDVGGRSAGGATRGRLDPVAEGAPSSPVADAEVVVTLEEAG